MKKNIVFSAVVVLFASAFVPLAKLGDSVITIFPVYDNFTIWNGLWEWRDISAFAVTYPVMLILILVFAVKEKSNVIKPLSGILFVLVFFILVSVLMTSTKVDGFEDLSFSFGYGWIVILLGFGILLLGLFNKSEI
jgi:uncharacterized membrane protein